ncbi:GNAT family N-acetyltransferase [Streptococcus macacae]|uniref:Acetyltransferase, GNAT family n=1 Tax=Streptococcus macacae NCTC 11558 TaxID=764298 RepID=G5JY62_9STRE|nr:GNAT family N-acetyltransferase [Streptococcus macacae]EHJ52057.1 acetyltransferase, GNAT family [Streptococcus macacae NCTC 11558]SUN77977.1 acetyltransferase [Streptococcus macacae NCTC 11558]
MLTIRHAKDTDLSDIIRIETENFSPEEAAELSVMRERIAKISDTFLVAEMKGRLVGYIEGPVINQRYLTDDLFHKVIPNPKESGYIAVTSLSIDKTFHKQGVGTALIAALKDLALAQKRLGITLTCHDYLIAYYEMNGFFNDGLSESVHGGSTWYNMIWENPKI